MTLILCEPGDLSAIWVAAELQQRGIAADLLFGSALDVVERWTHRIVAGTADVEIVLMDGRLVSSQAPVPILNRLAFVPTARLRRAGGADYGYAVQELYAFYLSWLHAWPATVLNRPSPQGLSGSYRHPSQWALLAAEAGLAAVAWEQSSDDADPGAGWGVAPGEAMAFVIAEECVLPPCLPPSLAGPCRKLAGLADTGLLGIGFVRAGEDWLVSGATPAPDLSLGGAALADALGRVLA